MLSHMYVINTYFQQTWHFIDLHKNRTSIYQGVPPHGRNKNSTDLQKLQDPPGKGQGVLEHPLVAPLHTGESV